MVVRSPRSLAFVAAALALAPRLSAGVIDVPAQQPSIQAGIDAAAAGDTVLVAPGHYVEHVDFHGKAVTVASSSGAALTTIDGGGSGSVVKFVSGEGAGSVLRGFTITGGTGSAAPPGLGDELMGGGLKVVASTPLLQELVITGNAAESGGGVLVNGQVGSAAHFVDCEIRANSGGGLISNRGRALLEGCTVLQNGSFGLSGENGSLTLTGCTIDGNLGDGIKHHVLYPNTGNLDMDGCVVSHNAGFGGGLTISFQTDGAFTLTSAKIRNTRIEANSGTTAAATYANAGFGMSAQFDHCVFTANGVPGQVTVNAHGTVSFNRCTFADNLGPAATQAEGVAKLNSCIVWNNPGTLPTGLSATYSDVQGGLAGTGNIDADPLFKDEGAGDFHLKGGSPCIDTGSPALAHDADGTITDMGAFAFAPFTDVGLGLAGTAGTAALSGTGTLIPGQLATFTLGGAAPNAPFVLIAGASVLFQPFKGGTVVPAPDILLTGLTDAGGNVVLAGAWPTGIPHGFITWLQFWITDAGGPKGYAASNGLAAEAR